MIIPPIINIVETIATPYISFMNEGTANVIPNTEEVTPAASNMFFADLFIILLF